jgi:hypothetical protein
MQLIVDIVDIRDESSYTFADCWLDIKEALLETMDCLRSTFIIVEQELKPHLAGGTDSKKRRKVFLIHSLYKYIHSLLVTL